MKNNFIKESHLANQLRKEIQDLCKQLLEKEQIIEMLKFDVEELSKEQKCS